MVEFQGLTQNQVLQSRSQYGENIVTPPPKLPWWKLYLEKFKDPIIRILIFATVISLIVGAIEGKLYEGIGILVAIFLATGISFFNEYKANKEFELLNQVNNDTPVKVIRDSAYCVIPKREVVVGDIVIVEIGEEIPADGEVLQSVSLQINESKLTGESAPVTKYALDQIGPSEKTIESTYPLHKILSQTYVSNGHGVIQITAVGNLTESAKTIRSALEENQDQTPLTKQLDKLGKYISVVGFLMAGLIFGTLLITGMMEHQIQLSSLLTYFMVAVTIIVVCVPEGLPMSVTLSLAYSMRKMIADNNLVRKMLACETIGAVTVICTDKTGTLTENKMKVVDTDIVFLNTEPFTGASQFEKLFIESLCANSTANLNLKTEEDPVIGNPTEGALLLWLTEKKINYLEVRNQFEIIAQQPFTTEKKYMATYGKSAIINKPILYIKGAPELILQRSSYLLTNQGIIKMDAHQKTIEESLINNQKRGLRTIGIAYKEIHEPKMDLAKEAESQLIWVGFMVISDPVRADVPSAIQLCQKAGINIKIITGDNILMAQEIARQIFKKDGQTEFSKENILTGAELNEMTDDEVLARLDQIQVIARAKPLDKLRIVKLLKQKQEVVAVTGDGTNDAPALNYADVGLAMGKTGTAVAKEASDMILLDDSFTSIVKGIMWGRSIYQNIQRFIVFQLTINFVALTIAILGPFIHVALPFTVIQMLWINLIMDTFAALALATEPPNADVMNEKPRSPNAFIINKIMLKEILGYGLLFILILIVLLKNIQAADSQDLSYQLTLFFNTFVMLQFWNLFNARSLFLARSSLKGLFKNKAFVGIVVLILVLQILLTQFGGEVIRTIPLSIGDWLKIILGTSLVLWIGEIKRLVGFIRSRR